MGPYGIGDRNDRGKRLLQFAQAKSMILTLGLIAEKYLERGRCVYTCNCFVDYTKAFDSVW